MYDGNNRRSVVPDRRMLLFVRQKTPMKSLKVIQYGRKFDANISWGNGSAICGSKLLYSVMTAGISTESLQYGCRGTDSSVEEMVFRGT